MLSGSFDNEMNPNQPNPHNAAALGFTGAPPYTSDTAPTAALPSYPAPACSPSSPQLLHVYRSGKLQQNIQILAPDKATILYTMRVNNALFSSKPSLTIYRADDTTVVVGTVKFHSLSNTIDLTVHNNPITFNGCGILSTSHEWTSLVPPPAAGGREQPMQFKWKNDSLLCGGDLICLDQQQQVCAKFHSSKWALRKDGKLELGPVVGGLLMDEVVVTGMAMLQLMKNVNSAAG